MQPYPAADPGRLTRIVETIGRELHVDVIDDAHRVLFEGWVTAVLRDAESRGAWWFLKNVASASLTAGADLIDLGGHVHKLGAVYAPQRLQVAALERIVELRQQAAADNRPNAGRPGWYALEAGRRLHLWPAPASTTAFAVLYRRPMAVEILPDEWESIVVLGALGRYGRHWDRDALVSRPAEIEGRYEAALRRARRESDDTCVSDAWGQFQAEASAGSRVTAGSASDAATAFVVPASLSGIGAVVIEAGDYLMEVG